jgi:3-phenylpropionate/trans-cinnamate dioxygenase ferredoxin subunit
MSELKEGEGKYVEIGGYRLAVFLHKGEPHVIDDECPHAGGAMSGGWVDDDGCAVCPWHGWSFGLCDGRLKGSTGVGVSVYPVRVHEHEGRKLVQVDLKMP